MKDFFFFNLVKAKILRFSCLTMDLADLGDKAFVITGSIQEKDATLFVRHIVEDIPVLCG